MIVPHLPNDVVADHCTITVIKIKLVILKGIKKNTVLLQSILLVQSYWCLASIQLFARFGLTDPNIDNININVSICLSK